MLTGLVACDFPFSCLGIGYPLDSVSAKEHAYLRITVHPKDASHFSVSLPKELHSGLVFHGGWIRLYPQTLLLILPSPSLLIPFYKRHTQTDKLTNPNPFWFGGKVIASVARSIS